MDEKEIPGYERYTITQEGFVTNEGRPVKIKYMNNSTPYVSLFKDGKYRNFAVAKLVATCFLGDTKKYPSDVICYRDGDNHNFHITNIYWSSRSEAYSTMFKSKTAYSENRLKNLRNKLCKKVECMIRTHEGYILDKKYDSIKDASEDKNVSSASISSALRNTNRMCAGRYWRYTEE